MASEDVVSQDVLKYQKEVQRVEARRDEDDDDFQAGGRTAKRRRSEAPKQQSTTKSRPATRKRHQAHVTADPESMTSPAVRSFEHLLTQATLPLHDNSPDDLTRLEAMYSTPLMLPLTSASPEDQRVSSSAAKKLNDSLLRKFTKKRDASPGKVAPAPPIGAVTKRKRQTKPRPSPLREDTPSPTMQSIEEPTADSRRPRPSNKRMPSPRPGSSTSATTTATIPHASDVFKIVAEVGNLGTHKTDAAQAMKAKQSELDELRAISQMADTAYEAALKRLPDNWQDILGFPRR
jgi:hypothetical protein